MIRRTVLTIVVLALLIGGCVKIDHKNAGPNDVKACAAIAQLASEERDNQQPSTAAIQQAVSYGVKAESSAIAEDAQALESSAGNNDAASFDTAFRAMANDCTKVDP